jgi:SAM-dependent methyltransferase
VGIYGSPDEALLATNRFYKEQEGFQYSLDYVTDWLDRNIPVPKRGRLLDLCCGDGIWSRGFQNLAPRLQIYGIDISTGGIQKARELLGSDSEHFLVGDVEGPLPFPSLFFDIVFARGPGLYNQHEMDRPETVEVIEQWHRVLKDNGRFYSIFASTPALMGDYTPVDAVKLPYNRAARRTAAVDFRGGKFHHSADSFNAPFERAEGIEILEYRFFNNLHFVVTTRSSPERA